MKSDARRKGRCLSTWVGGPNLPYGIEDTYGATSYPRVRFSKSSRVRIPFGIFFFFLLVCLLFSELQPMACLRD
jgi:hypothetical protein